MRFKAPLAIALQMILWHQTTNGSTMLHHGRGVGERSNHGQSQQTLILESEQLIPGASTNMRMEVQAQERFVTTGDVIKLKFEADRNNSWSNGVSDGNHDPLDVRYGDYDPFAPEND